MFDSEVCSRHSIQTVLFVFAGMDLLNSTQLPSNQKEISSFFHDIIFPRLPNDLVDLLDSPIIEVEINAAVARIKSGNGRIPCRIL